MGGNTIAQAKRNMSVPEFNAWCVYRQKRGSLNTGRRVEQSVGVSSSILATLAGSKDHSTIDYMPHEEAHEPEPKEITLEQAMQDWK